MAKQEDVNGFWLIEDNPISKEGVFPYLGRQISPKLEPDKIYYVYRPFSELANPETIKSFNGVPLINDHQMLGKRAGFNKYDNNPARGTLYNVQARDGMLYGDFKILSEDIQKKIEDGKEELSLGYVCKYELKKGVWNGKPYDAIQRNIRGNHVALVDEGRMGHDVRLRHEDSKTPQLIFDSIETIKEIKKMADKTKKSGCDKAIDKSKLVEFVGGLDELGDETKKKILDFTDTPEAAAKAAKDENVDKRKLIDEIGGILKGKVDDEIIRTVIKKAEEISYNDSSKGSGNDDATSAKSNEGKDKAAKDEDPDKPKDDTKKGEDKQVSMDEIERQLSKRQAKKDKLVKDLEPHIGVFDHSAMTLEDVAEYGCKKLEITVDRDQAVVACDSFLKGAAKNPKVVFTVEDTALPHTPSAGDPALAAYLKQKRS